MKNKNCGAGETFEDIVYRRMARRSFLKGALLTAPLLIAGPGMLSRGSRMLPAGMSCVSNPLPWIIKIRWSKSIPTMLGSCPGKNRPRPGQA